MTINKMIIGLSLLLSFLACSSDNELGGPGTTTSTVAKIEGDIVDSKGLVSAYSRVALFSKSEDDIIFEKETESDINGEFAFDSLGSGEFLIYSDKSNEGATSDLIVINEGDSTKEKSSLIMHLKQSLRIKSTTEINRLFGLNRVEVFEDSLGYFKTDFFIDGESKFWIEFSNQELRTYVGTISEDKLRFSSETAETTGTYEFDYFIDNPDSTDKQSGTQDIDSSQIKM